MRASRMMNNDLRAVIKEFEAVGSHDLANRYKRELESRGLDYEENFFVVDYEERRNNQLRAKIKELEAVGSHDLANHYKRKFASRLESRKGKKMEVDDCDGHSFSDDIEYKEKGSKKSQNEVEYKNQTMKKLELKMNKLNQKMNELLKWKQEMMKT